MWLNPKEEQIGWHTKFYDDWLRSMTEFSMANIGQMKVEVSCSYLLILLWLYIFYSQVFYLTTSILTDVFLWHPREYKHYLSAFSLPLFCKLKICGCQRYKPPIFFYWKDSDFQANFFQRESIVNQYLPFVRCSKFVKQIPKCYLTTSSQ